MTKQQPSPREMGFYMSLAQVGAEMVVPIVIGLLLDVYTVTSPWGIIIGAVAGFTLGIVHLISLVNRHDQADSSKQEQDSR